MGKLALNFSYSFNGKIWNIISHPDQERLLIEVRDSEKLQASFNAMDLTSYQFLLKDVSFHESWWIGVSLLVDDIILFHTYPEQDNPDYKTFFAYDISQVKIRWEKENINILQTTGHFFEAMSKGVDELKYYDLITGEEVRNQNTQDDLMPEENKWLTQPFHYKEGSDYFNTVGDFLRDHLNITVVRGVDYFENEQVIIISYYLINRNNLLANDLLVVNHRGEHLLNERLGNDLGGISDETFFICNNKLIFVKDNSDFLVYELAKSAQGRQDR